MLKLMLIIASIMFMMSTHPMKSLVCILSSTILVTYPIFEKNQSQWLVYVLLLVFLGGLMILFTYVVTLVPNENSSMSKNKTIVMLLLSAMVSQNIMWGNTPSSELMKTMYSNSPTSLILIMLSIAMMLVFSTKLIFEPFKPMKSMF